MPKCFTGKRRGKNQDHEQKRTFFSVEDVKTNTLLPLAAEKGDAELKRNMIK